MRRLGWLLVLTLLSVLAVSAVLRHYYPRMDVTAEVNPGDWVPVELPWRFQDAAQNRKMMMTFAPGQTLPGWWRVYPDDALVSITVNDKAVALDAVRDQLGNYWSGFPIDLSPYFEPGTNRVVFTLNNGAGPGGLQVQPELGVAGWMAMMAAFLPFLLGLCWCFRLRASQIAVLLCALLPLAAYWADTTWEMRTHDTSGREGHIGYVQWVADNVALPAPNEGWTYYHPPLYYMAGAAVLRWAEWLSLPGPESLQALSFALWLIFLTASAGALRTALRGRQGWLLVATGALAFWPVGVIHSIRLGNDAGFYAMAGAAFYFAVRFWRARRTPDLWGMSIFTALALLSKTTAVALAAALGVMLLWRMLLLGRRKWKPAAVHVLIFGLVSATGLALSLVDNVYYYLNGKLASWLVAGGSALSDDLRVPVEWKYFVPLDIPTFLSQPWMRAYEDSSGRAHFWNYLLRTALTGEFDLPGKLQLVVSYLWGGMLLILVFLATARTAVIRHATTSFYRHLPWWLLAFFTLASMIALRIQVPFSCSNDFRYALPILVPAMLWFVHAGGMARALLVAMVPLSSLVFMTL